MSVRILYSTASDMAALYCSTTDVAFGPVFYGNTSRDGYERAEAFTQWLKQDARRYDDSELQRLYGEWLDQEEAQFAAKEAAETVKP